MSLSPIGCDKNIDAFDTIHIRFFQLKCHKISYKNDGGKG